ncbi:MAG: response regulator [Lachnospiraceae bacterium]|nr:response regulator [Lachnospiraceae bacterium]
MITAYQIVIIIQIVALAAAMFGTYSLFCSMLRPESKYLLAACVCAVAYGLGYLMEILAKNPDMAFDALCVQYCGLAYLAFMFVVYLIRYTRIIRFHSAFWKLVFVYETITLGLVLTSRYHHLYYRALTFEDNGIFPHFHEQGTILFYLFMAHLGILSFTCCVIALRVALTTASAKRKRAFWGIFLAAISSFVAMTVSMMVGFEGYEPTSAILLLVLGVISVVKTAGRTTDPVELAYAQSYQRAKVGLIVLNEERCYLDSNLSAQQIYPELAKQDVGSNFAHTEELMDAAGRNEVMQIGERYYNVYFYQLGDEKVAYGYVIGVADITESEMRAREFAELKKAAEEASEAKSYFLANMSHEMRTPLNAIIGLAELAQKDDSENTKKEYLPQILSSGQMLLDIISDVLDFSKAESGKVDIIPEEYDLKECLNTVINVINIRLGDKDLDFIVDIDPTIPDRLIGDDARIRQILINFLTNAVKYTDSGFIRLAIDWDKLGSELLLKASVTDSGRGIKQEDIGKLFSVFSRFDLKNNRNIQGTGLGLAITGHLIKLMNGTYRVESEYGKGSTFSCILPQKIAARDPISNKPRREIHLKKNVPFVLYGNEEELETSAAAASEDTTKEKSFAASVLIVDDNTVNIKVLKAMLKNFGIVADAAVSGPDAIGMSKQKKYDMILMDHMMPDMDGIEAAQKIRELDTEWAKDLIIIACTANAVKGAEEMFLENGMNDYICKPIKLAELQAMLEKWLPAG